ncbi:MAG: helix-turn-helix domain-containing protein [Fidelibacterota bacterium]
MANFYEELKALRERQNIALEEIHERTKINLNYLQALEKGQFEVLPKTYIRLFLKAYVTEIGGDAKEALDQLERYLSAMEATTAPLPKETEVETPVPAKEETPSTIRPPTKLRSDLAKAAVFLVVFLFAIYIIKKMSSETSAAVGGNGTPVLLEEVTPVTEALLQNEFQEYIHLTDAIEPDPPYTVKIAARERLWYRSLIDSTDETAGILSAGESITRPFEESLDFLLNPSGAVKYIKINGVDFTKMEPTSYPSWIGFRTKTKTISIRQYIPQK